MLEQNITSHGMLLCKYTTLFSGNLYELLLTAYRRCSTCFGWMSKRYERRYRRKGLDDNQLLLVRELESMGLDGLTLLEVGCGVGALHQTLLEKGASTATGVDLAPRMLQLAENRARDHKLEQRTQYRLGDFVEMSKSLSRVDVTVWTKWSVAIPRPRN
ncbi:MAG: hypothetical protein CM1200mP20_11810 [Pseudomonadota bacterium]|nr:MAG: hypothetical protein CM1200mP20_11810 [Pseudomonadota bacterium]